MTGVLDTSTVVLLRRLVDTTGLPEEPTLTTLTLAELSFEPIPFDSDAARTSAGLAAALRAEGRKRVARSYDALIAATALSRGLAVHTCVPDHFQGIEGLEVVEVPHPDR